MVSYNIEQIIFLEICSFRENYDFSENILEKNWNFFTCDFVFFDDSIGCATKFHAHEILFISISF